MIRLRLVHYFVAAAAVGLTAAIKPPIEHLVGSGPPVLFFVPAVTLAAWIGGLGPGLLAVGLSSAICCYYYLPPNDSFWVDNSNDRFRLLFFGLQGALTSVLMELLRAARRKAESYRHSLGRSEMYINTLMDNAPAFIYVKDAEGRYLMTNRYYKGLFDNESRPLAGRTDLDIHPRDLAEKYRADDRAVLASGRPLQCEDIGRLADGDHTYLTIKFPLRDASGVCYAVGGFSTDITERKRAEEVLKESEGRLRCVTETARVGLVVVDEDHRYLYANRAYVEHLGLTQEDILGLKMADVLAPVYESQIRPQLDRAFRGELVTYELTMPERGAKPGVTRSLTVACEPQVNYLGERVVVVIVDVTEQRRAEESSKENEGRLRLFIEHAPAAIAMFDREMRYIAASRRWRADHKLGEQSLIGRSHYDIAPDIPERWKAIHNQALSGDVVEADEDRFDRADGTVLWLRWEVRPWLNAAGELGGIVVAIEDITERKRAEVVNARLAAIVDSSDDAIVGNDLEGVITSWNAAAERLFGYAADEAVGSSLALIIPRDRLDEEAEILDQLRRGILVDHYETERLRKDGRLVDVSLTVSLVRDVTGHVVGASKIARDITERKRADKAVAHLAAIVDSSEDSIVSEDLDGLVVSWNAGAQRILGYAPDEAIGRPIDAVLNRPDRPGEATALIANAERGERIRNFETQRLRKDGSLVDVSVNISPIRDRAGKRIGISRIHHDITERKRAEEARRELERMARSIFDSISSHIAVLDESGSILGVNRSWRLFAEANGFVGQANEGANYLDVCDSAAGEDREMAAAFATGIREVLVGQRASFELEYPCHSPSQRRWFIGRVTPFPNGGPRRVVVSHQDVTALKEAEEHLRNRERMLSQSQMMAHVGSWELDLDDLSDLYLGGLRWSEECFRIFGYEPGQVAVTKDLFFQAVHPDDRDAVSAALARALRENGSYGIEHRIVRPDGVERVVFEWGESITNPSGRPIRVLGTCQDITERKRAEEDLRYQLRLNRAITEKVGESIFLIDEQGRLLFLNEEATRVFGFTFEELGGTVLHDAIHHHYPDGRPFPWEECSSASICRTGQGIRSHESTYFRKDGSVVVAVCANAPLEVDGRRIGVVFILHDITERKRSEMDLRHYANRLEHLREIDHAILSSHSPREIAEAAMRHLARLVPYWTAGVSFYDFDRDEVEVLATDGLLREWYPSGNRYQEELKARLEIYALPHEQISIGEEAQTSPLMEALRVAGMRSYVSIPLREGARPAGSLLLVSDSLAGFSAEQIEVAREVADHLAIAIRQAILHEDLRLARARMEALSRQLLRAQEDERRRIARELHDEIGQAMTALKINLQTLIQGGEDGASRLEESVTIVDQTLQQVRGMALDLRPSILDDLGLVAALEWYIGRYTQRTGLLGRFVADPDHIQADPEIETTCFRVAQEALTNVARHARATRFSVELVQHSGGLQLVIRDDGIGFDPEAALGAASRGVSFGLAGMRERVELIGGRIAFVSEPAEGTEIQVDFPETPIMPRNIFEENDPGGPK